MQLGGALKYILVLILCLGFGSQQILDTNFSNSVYGYKYFIYMYTYFLYVFKIYHERETQQFLLLTSADDQRNLLM